jgi:hypothetical protein
MKRLIKAKIREHIALIDSRNKIRGDYSDISGKTQLISI